MWWLSSEPQSRPAKSAPPVPHERNESSPRPVRRSPVSCRRRLRLPLTDDQRAANDELRSLLPIRTVRAAAPIAPDVDQPVPITAVQLEAERAVSTQMRADVRRLESALRETAAQHRDEIARLHGRIAHADAIGTLELGRAAATSRKRFEEIEQQLARRDAQIIQLTGQLKIAEENHLAAISRGDQLASALAEAERRCSHAILDGGAQDDSRDCEIEELRRRVEYFEADRRQWESDQVAPEPDSTLAAERWEYEAYRWRAAHESARCSHAKESQRLRDESNQLRDEVSHLNELANQGRDEADRLRNELHRQEEKLAAVRRQQDQLGTVADQQFQSLRTRIDELVSSAQSESDARRVTEQQWSNCQDQLAVLTDQITQLHRERAALRQQIQKRQIDHTNDRVELQACRAALATIAVQLRRAREAAFPGVDDHDATPAEQIAAIADQVKSLRRLIEIGRARAASKIRGYEREIADLINAPRTRAA